MAGTIALIAFLAMIAAFIQRVSGFGFGIFIMTSLPLLMPTYGEATALSGLLAFVVALVPAITMRKHLPVRKLWIILTTFLVVSFFSIFFVSKIDSALLRRVLGGFPIIIAIYFFFFSSRIHIRPNAKTQISMGTLSGIMGGLFAMQGPPAVIYFIGCSETKEEYTALTQWYFLVGNLMMSFFRAGNGFVTPVVGKIWCFAVFGIFIGLFIGAKVYQHINTFVLRRIVYSYMAVAGCVMLFLE